MTVTNDNNTTTGPYRYIMLPIQKKGPLGTLCYQYSKRAYMGTLCYQYIKKGPIWVQYVTIKVISL